MINPAPALAVALTPCPHGALPTSLLPRAVAGAGPTQRRRWAKADMAYLQAHYGHIPATRIAASLGRTVDAIHRRAWEWGLETTQEQRNRLMRGART